MTRVNHLKLIQEGHERVTAQLERLREVIQEIALSPSPVWALRLNRKKLGAVFHFMETVGFTQHLYEEDTLFPLLLERPPELMCDKKLLDSMKAEHEEFRKAIRESERQLERLLRKTTCEVSNCRLFCARLMALMRRLERHIRKEKQCLYPLLAETPYQEVTN